MSGPAEVRFRFPVDAPPDRVFPAISDPSGLDEWWSAESSGRAAAGELYHLGFGPGYDWVARVTECAVPSLFELEFVAADSDWTGTVVRFDLAPEGRGTLVEFSHRGWAEANEHFTTSAFCWAMYLRIMKRFVEAGERVAYADRLNV